MPLSFPSSPSVGATSQQNGRTYSWTGYAWELVAASGGGSGEDALLRSLFVPPAPTGVTASAGNAQATVSWTAPSGVIAQAPITDYAVQFQPAGGSWQPFTDGTSTATSATVTGLTNGTAYTFKVAATNAVGTGSYSTASSAVTPVAGDALWANVQLLLHGDGNLDDSSSYRRTVSTTGTVSTAGTARYGSASIEFSGSGRIVVPSDESLTFDGDFTIECWVQFSAKPSNYIALFAGSSGATQMFLTTKVSGNGLRWGLSATAEYAAGDFTWSIGTWYHVAVRRASGAVTLWVDGTNITSGSPTNTTTYSGGMNLFGGIASVSDYSGLVDEFRITKGVARTITVPTGAFPSVGPSGVASDGYFSSVSLLLHADGTGSTFVDSSATPKTLTAVGNATQSAAQSKWGGKSALFDGAGDGLTVPNSSELNLAGVDWVIEAWLYPTSSPQYTCVAGKRSGSDPTSYYIYIQNGVMGFYNGTVFNTSGTIPANQWTHIAWSMASGTLRAYAGGTKVGEWSSATISEVDTSLKIGRHFSSVEEAFAGYIDDLRITKGSSRGYTGATITVPTAAFPDAGNYTDPFMDKVSLLLHADGTGSTFVDSSPTPKSIAATNATQSATQSKWGGKSAYFDGSTSRVSASPSSALSLGTGDFCAEMWVYPSGASAYQTLFSTRSSNTGEDSSNVFFGFNTGTLTPIVYTNSLVLSGSSSVSAGTWSHIAFVRESGVVSIYLNGTRIGSTSFSTSIIGTNASIGLTEVNQHQFAGYIDDFRLTVGSNRGYTGSTITVPTAAFPDA